MIGVGSSRIRRGVINYYRGGSNFTTTMPSSANDQVSCRGFPTFSGLIHSPRFTARVTFQRFRCIALIMYRETLPIDQLGAWARLNNITINGLKITTLQGNRGSGLVATAERPMDNATLMTIPNDLVLSLENVWLYAKSDKHLHQTLEATGDYSRVSCSNRSINHSDFLNVN